MNLTKREETKMIELIGEMFGTTIYYEARSFTSSKGKAYFDLPRAERSSLRFVMTFLFVLRHLGNVHESYKIDQMKEAFKTTRERMSYFNCNEGQKKLAEDFELKLPTWIRLTEGQESNPQPNYILNSIDFIKIDFKDSLQQCVPQPVLQNPDT